MFFVVESGAGGAASSGGDSFPSDIKAAAVFKQIQDVRLSCVCVHYDTSSRKHLKSCDVQTVAYPIRALVPKRQKKKK